MKKGFLFVCASVAGLLMIFSSCQKSLDAGKTDEVMGTPLPGQPTYCRIESLWEKNTFPAGGRFVLFLYDQYENPVAITEGDLDPTTGRSYKTFKYDQWHRLREFRGEYGNGKYRFWHFYGFDQNGRIGVDTLYSAGTIGMNGPVDYDDRIISKLEYDNQGRIVKEVSSHQNFPGTSESTYSYNSAGNFIYPPTWPYPIEYDNSMNVSRTNDIWMFLNRNYSVNNPFVAHNYNQSRFPTEINSNQLILWLEYLIGQSQFSYNCRESHW